MDSEDSVRCAVDADEVCEVEPDEKLGVRPRPGIESSWCLLALRCIEDEDELRETEKLGVRPKTWGESS